MSSSIFLTFDLDWVSDWVLESVIENLEKYKLKATFFATHKSTLLQSLDKSRYEIGLHPNFDCGDGRYDLSALEKLKNLYPNSIGMRSHGLFFSSKILEHLNSCNIRYESNIFMLDHLGLHPTQRSAKITSIPFNWSDDKHLELGREFALSQLPSLKNKGLNVFNFHPIHFFLNTEKYSRYENAKVNFNKKDMIKEIYDGVGIANLLKLLTLEISEKKIKTKLMKELCCED
jgi:hypothetical protein